jgi:hypothetical protein
MCSNATAKKRKRKIAAICKHGSKQSSAENTSHLADKKPFEKDQNGGDIHERTDRRITSTETVFLAKEHWRRRRSCKSRKTVTTTTTIAAEELHHLSKP